jgi:hypothetical protein
MIDYRGTLRRKDAHAGRSNLSVAPTAFLESRTPMSREPSLNSTQLPFGVHRLDRTQASRGAPVDFTLIDMFMIALASPSDTDVIDRACGLIIGQTQNSGYLPKHAATDPESYLRSRNP